MFFDIHTNISFPGSMVDAGPIISLTFLPSLLFVTRTRKLLHVSNLSKPSCIASTWRRPDLLPLSFLTCRWYKIQVVFYSHTWGLHSIVVSIFVNVLVEFTNTVFVQYLSVQPIHLQILRGQCCLLSLKWALLHIILWLMLRALKYRGTCSLQKATFLPTPY